MYIFFVNQNNKDSYLFQIGLLGFEVTGRQNSQDTSNPAEDDVIVHNLRQLRKMPAVPFLNSHGEGVDVLIERIEDGDGVHDRLVLSVRIELHLIPGVAMSQPTPGLIHIILLNVLGESWEVKEGATKEF